MLYDLRAHLPSLVDKMMSEDYRQGDVTKLEADKVLITKLLADSLEFGKKIQMIDTEHKKRKDAVIKKLEELEKTKVTALEELDTIEKDYWETIIGEVTRAIAAMQATDAEEP